MQSINDLLIGNVTEEVETATQDDVDNGDIWSSDASDTRSDTNGANTGGAGASNSQGQMFFSEDELSDDGSYSPEDNRQNEAEVIPDGSAGPARPPRTQIRPLSTTAAAASSSTAAPAASAARPPQRRKRARDGADSLGRDIWLPLYGMTVLEQEALPALALCPSRYILIRFVLVPALDTILEPRFTSHSPLATNHPPPQPPHRVSLSSPRYKCGG
jgi:hypothetical protein